MLRSLLATLAASAALLGAAPAQAGTHWSIGISLPATGVVVADAPPYPYYVPEPAPIYYEPAPVVRYVPVPRYVEREVYYAPPPPRVIYEPVYRERRWEDRDDRWDHGRRDRGQHRGWDDEGPRRWR